MVQRGNRACFLFEAPQSIGVFSQRLWQHFDRDITPEPRVACAVHLAHASRAQRRLDLVRTQFCTGAECHACA